MSILFTVPIYAKSYKHCYPKHVTVTPTEDEKYWRVSDKEGNELFKLKACKKIRYVKSYSGLHARVAPSTRSKNLKTLKFRKKITVLGVHETKQKNKWVLIKYKKKYAFVWSKFLVKKRPKNRRYLGKFTITAYEWDGSRCANGNYPRKKHTVACNSLKLGTKVYIQGVGKRVVEDRGASWHSDNWMDIYLGSVSACNKWGVRTRKVWVIK